MQITLELPDDVAEGLAHRHQDVPRAVLGAVIIEAVRSGVLSIGRAAEVLHTSRYAMDGLLKRAGVESDYTLEDLERDRQTLRQLGL